jgi:raffinose/stachyose/melibiose transport system substrate-binding protein
MRSFGLMGCVLASLGVSAAAGTAFAADPVTIKLGSWRTEDIAVWQDKILPLFEARYPDIKVEFAPVNTNEYNAAIQSQMEAGAGPDLITCRPFDVNRDWIKRGYYEQLADLDGMKNFDETSRAAWTDDKNTPFCMPVAAVLAGFFYNIDIFNELGIQPPKTQEEFLAALRTIKDSGKYEPLAYGSADSWQLAYNGLYSIGPTYWHGEDGRHGLIDGKKKLTDPEFVAAFKALADWKPYLPSGYQSLSYPDMTQLFTIGKAAILPDGSWNINQVTATGLNIGVFAPPVAKDGDQRYLQEMPDMAIGINARSANKDAARTFLNWVAGPEFQEAYVNEAPGFFAMSNQKVAYKNALAQQFADLKTGARLTPRLALDRLSSGNPPLDDDIWRVVQTMMNGDSITPEAATAELQKGLSSWYGPQKN